MNNVNCIYIVCGFAQLMCIFHPVGPTFLLRALTHCLNPVCIILFKVVFNGTMSDINNVIHVYIINILKKKC